MPYSVERGGGYPHYKYSVKHASRSNFLKKMKKVKISSPYGKGLLARKPIKSRKKVENMKSDISTPVWGKTIANMHAGAKTVRRWHTPLP